MKRSDFARYGWGSKNSHQKQNKLLWLFSLLAMLTVALPAQAAITVPGADGTDGVLHITEDTVIDLAQAVTGTWNDDNSANAGKGVYDPQQWAVVFKYTSVTVDEGATLTFSNHPSRAPVVWLVSADVTIDGTLSLDGQGFELAPANSEPGPGGFRGSTGTYAEGVLPGAGFGPGGGGLGTGGSYGTMSANGPLPYGNQSLIPLIGGSGGGGGGERHDEYGKRGGAAGGGAILIACQGTIIINGIVSANGGDGSGYGVVTGSGSGGGIRLVADTFAGTGAVNALGGGGGPLGGMGRIRIERVTNEIPFVVVPIASLLTLAPDAEATLWPPDGAPSVKIISIGGEESPTDPRAAFGTVGADVVLPEVATTPVVIETTNVEEASQVELRLTPQFNESYTVVPVADHAIVSTSPLVIRWTADIPVNVGYATMQVKVVRP